MECICDLGGKLITHSVRCLSTAQHSTGSLMQPTPASSLKNEDVVIQGRQCCGGEVAGTGGQHSTLRHKVAPCGV
jgi:hypothetical protein